MSLDFPAFALTEERQPTAGGPVADPQGVPFMLADAAMKLEAARQLTCAAAAKSEHAMAGEKVADLTFFSSACKCFASDVAMEVTILPRQAACGSRGPGAGCSQGSASGPRRCTVSVMNLQCLADA